MQPCIDELIPSRPLCTTVLVDRGAEWTRAAQRHQTETGRLYHGKLEALVGELVALMESVAADAQREWRGGPFLPPVREVWPKELTALWEALRKVHRLAPY